MSASTLADLTVGEWTREGFTTQVVAKGAFDCIANPCGQRGCGERKGASHGRGGLRFLFWLIGPDGGVDFDLHLPFDVGDPHRFVPRRGVSAGGVFVHRAEPWFDGQLRREGECHLTRGEFCYSDGSFLAGDDAWAALLANGTDGLWEYLHGWYEQTEATS